ncbi:MAG: GNVR domain-containing protein [Elusimicrobiota bacterium]
MTQNDEINLLTVVNPVLKHWKFVVLFSFWVAVISLVMLIFKPGKYTAEVKMFVGQAGGALSRIEALTTRTQSGGGIYSDALGRDRFGFYTEMLKSRGFLLRLANKKISINGQKSETAILDFFKIKGIDNPRVKEETLYNTLVGTIETAADTQTSILTIKITTGKSEVSAELANSIAAELETASLEFLSMRSRARRRFVEEKLKETETRLKESENNLKRFQEMNRAISKSPELQLKEEQLKRAVRMEEELYLSLNKELELTRLEENQDIAPITVLEKAVVPLYKSGPRRLVVLTGSTVGGFCVSIFLVLVNYFFTSIQTQKSTGYEEFQQNLNSIKTDFQKIWVGLSNWNKKKKN